MRVGVAALVLVLVATSAAAEVHIATDKHGRRVIYNIPGGKVSGGTNWQWLAKQQDRPSRYDPIIERYAQQYGVNPTLIRAVIQVESDFNPRTVSKKGARGLMQLIPATAKRYGVELEKIHDPEHNIRGGVRYLADLSRMFSGDLPRVLAAYNAGENAVIRHGGIPPYQETTTYVKRALTVYYGRPYGQAVMFAGDARKATLHGGFAGDPLAVALLPGMRVLGRH
jgi:soluble lytic murein transglycosylase-like protein